MGRYLNSLVDTVLNTAYILHIAAAVPWHPAEINKYHIVPVQMLPVILAFCHRKPVKYSTAVHCLPKKSCRHATVNIETAEKIGLDYSMFSGMCETVKEITTAEEFE